MCSDTCLFLTKSSFYTDCRTADNGGNSSKEIGKYASYLKGFEEGTENVGYLVVGGNIK